MDADAGGWITGVVGVCGNSLSIILYFSGK